MGLLAVGVGTWWLLRDASGPPDAQAPEAGAMAATAASTRPTAPAPAPAAAPAETANGLRIASGERLRLDANALPDTGPLSLVLELGDETRASGEHTARVVSPDGRRVDLTATALPGSGSGLRLEIDPAFLTPGLYMIEVDTAEAHPLPIRRYVLEID